MLALIGMVCFILRLFEVDANGIDLLALGLAFVAAHLALDGYVTGLVKGRKTE